MVTVREIMKHNLVTLPYGSSVADAARTMREKRIGSILIRMDHRIVGIVTEPDIVREVVGAGRTPEFILVQDIMSFPIVSIEERGSLTDAADMMERHKTRHLAVTKSGAIVGVVSVRDLLHPVSIDEF